MLSDDHLRDAALDLYEALVLCVISLDIAGGPGKWPASSPAARALKAGREALQKARPGLQLQNGYNRTVSR